LTTAAYQQTILGPQFNTTLVDPNPTIPGQGQVYPHVYAKNEVPPVEIENQPYIKLPVALTLNADVDTKSDAYVTSIGTGTISAPANANGTITYTFEDFDSSSASVGTGETYYNVPVGPLGGSEFKYPQGPGMYTIVGSSGAVQYDINGDGTNIVDMRNVPIYVFSGSIVTGVAGEEIFTITTPGELQMIDSLTNYSQTMSGSETIDYKLLADLSFKLATVPFDPIGSDMVAYNGHFDGNNMQIQDIIIDTTTTTQANTGLFAKTGSAAVISGVGITQTTATKSTITGTTNTGALVGTNAGTVTNSYSKADVVGTNATGNLVGNNVLGGTISYTYAYGKTSGVSQVGGLVGANAGTISTSYTTGEVNATANNLGGIAGFNDATGVIDTSFAIGEVKSTTGSNAAGLVGNNSGAITNSYTLSNITAVSGVGNIVGANAGTYTNTYGYAGQRLVGTASSVDQSLAIKQLAAFQSVVNQDATLNNAGTNFATSRVDSNLYPRVYQSGTTTVEVEDQEDFFMPAVAYLTENNNLVNTDSGL
jgi:hypothetical protein